MTSDMTLGRRAAAFLVAGITFVLALGWMAGDAQAARPDRELRALLRNGVPGAKVISPTRVEWPRRGVTVLLTRGKADWSGCTGKWICLWENVNGRGRMIYFATPGKFRLKNWSMGPDPARHKGVTSYWKRRSGGAKLWGPNFRHNVAPGRHNLPRSINDRSSYLQIL
jgi:hypothetical protein